MLQSSQVRPRVWRGACALLLALLVSAVLPSAAQFARAASTFTVQYGTPTNLTNTSVKSVFPSTVVDANNKTHIVYVADVLGADGSVARTDLLYTNNVNGTFSAPQIVQQGVGTNAEPFFKLAVGPDGALHVVYSWLGNDRQIYYRKATLSGANATWSDPQLVSTGTAKAVAPFVTVDSSGNAHIVWTQQICAGTSGTTYSVQYRVRNANGTLSATSTPNPTCVFQDRPQVALTADGKAHVLYQFDRDINYARLEGTTWVRQDISQSPNTNSNNSAFTTDGTALYAAWGEGIGSGNQDVLFRRSTDGGQNWSSVIAISDTPQFATFPDMAWAASAQRVYITWADATGAADNQTEIWYREFDPSDGTTTDAKRLTTITGISTLPSIGVGPGQSTISWGDRTSGDWQIYYVTGPVAGGCSGTLRLENGSAATNKSTLAGVITPSAGCTPDQMKISVDAPPSASTPSVAYSSNVSVIVPASAACARTVYVQLFSAGRSGSVFQTSINVDTAITANVFVANPHLSSLSPVYTPPRTGSATIQAAEDILAGASDGDPNYTRSRSFFLNVRDSGDCSGVTRFNVPGSISGDVPSAGFAAAVPLPGNADIGMKTFTVELADTAGNTSSFPVTRTYELMYDPANTDPTKVESDVTKLAGLPVLASGGQFAADTNTLSVVRTLTFSNISVSDNVYGRREGLAAGRQFWGVWVATSATQTTADNANLKWFPVPVTSPGASFSIRWNLFSGLNYGSDANRAGTYYVYVRFLDGAGNPSLGSVSTQAVLVPGYSLPDIYIPIARTR